MLLRLMCMSSLMWHTQCVKSEANALIGISTVDING